MTKKKTLSQWLGDIDFWSSDNTKQQIKLFFARNVQDRVVCSDVHKAFCKWSGRNISSIYFGRLVSQCVPSIERVRVMIDGQRYWVYRRV